MAQVADVPFCPCFAAEEDGWSLSISTVHLVTSCTVQGLARNTPIALPVTLGTNAHTKPYADLRELGGDKENVPAVR